MSKIQTHDSYKNAKEKKILHFLMGAIAAFGAALIGGCIFVIASLFTPAHFWDQWEMVKYVSQGGSFSLGYLFTPHNEHIIATSKLLFYVDMWLFGYSNRSLVAAIVVIHLSIAFVFASILLGMRLSLEKILWFCVFGAMMLSLVQWENLTIGFQTQFGLTCLFAVLACAFTTRFLSDVNCSKLTFTAVSIFIALAIFSMGNGIAIAGSLVVIALLVRPLRIVRVVATFLAYALCLAFFVFQRSGGSASTHVDLKALPELLRFFIAVLGGPFIGSVQIAFYIGIVVLALFSGIFVLAGLLPRIRGKDVDRSTVILLGAMVFALGSAAAVTVGRFSFGPGAALTSRYATPNILLYCSLLAAHYRYVIDHPNLQRWRMFGPAVFGLFGLLVACGLIFRPAGIHQLIARSETLESASYFVLSGVTAEAPLGDLYPSADAIRGPIEYLRTQKLNIFSEEFGIATLGKKRIENVGRLPACPVLDVDSSARLEAKSWKLAGSIAGNLSGDRPQWLITTDMAGDVLGFAPPARWESAGRFHFAVPVHSENSDFDLKVYLLAQWGEDELCRYEDLVTLPPRQLLDALPGQAAAISSEIWISMAGDATKLPDAIQHADRALQLVKSTWQGDDTATGSVTFAVSDTGGTCPDVYVGVIRGPTSEGISIEFGEEGGEIERITLDGIRDHQWRWLQIRHAGECTGMGLSFVKLNDNGREWGAWGAITEPFILVRSPSM